MKLIKHFLLAAVLVSIMTAPLYGNRFCRWFCERYHDAAYDADGFFHGYEDLYSYPFGYALPTNRYFNYCPPCPFYFNCDGETYRARCNGYYSGSYYRNGGSFRR